MKIISIFFEILQLLKEAGCYRIWIGAESGSQKIIDAMDRRVDVNVVKDAIIKTNEIGIETGTFIMLGYPDKFVPHGDTGRLLEDLGLTPESIAEKIQTTIA